MSDGTEAMPGLFGFLQGRTAIGQITLAVILTVVLYSTMLALEAVYQSYKSVAGTAVIIKDETVLPESEQYYITNPNEKKSNTVVLPFSDNQRTGIEYTFSFFLLIRKGAFPEITNTPAVQGETMRHIMHRGYRSPFPLMSPGVFLMEHNNVLRFYQNSTTTWNNYVDVTNVPVNKWMHIAIVTRNNGLEVYLNGNVASKLNLKGGVIYQNYENLRLFSTETVGPYTNVNLTSLKENERFEVSGKADIIMSRFRYYSYALSYTEIQDLIAMGPNPKMDSSTQIVPPYFVDNWWSGQNYLV
jgi:hypothetical protein